MGGGGDAGSAILTDDVSLQVFMDHLKKLAVSTTWLLVEYFLNTKHKESFHNPDLINTTFFYKFFAYKLSCDISLSLILFTRVIFLIHHMFFLREGGRVLKENAKVKDDVST